MKSLTSFEYVEFQRYKGCQAFLRFQSKTVARGTLVKGTFLVQNKPQSNKISLQPVSRPVEQVSLLKGLGWVYRKYVSNNALVYVSLFIKFRRKAFEEGVVKYS